MSKRIWIALLLWLGAAAVHAGPADHATQKSQHAMRLGDSSWVLYRPLPRSAAIHDLNPMMERLRSDVPKYVLRFTDSMNFALELRIAPLLDHNDFIGPVYGQDIGATQFVLSFSF